MLDKITKQHEMTVEDLDDYIEGYLRVFEEDEVINIESTFSDLQILSFDQTFQNVPFKSLLSIEFSNPIDPDYLSARVDFFIRGEATPVVKDNYQLGFSFKLEQAKVKSFSPYFFSETT